MNPDDFRTARTLSMNQDEQEHSESIIDDELPISPAKLTALSDLQIPKN